MIKQFCDRCGAEMKESKYAWIKHRAIYARIGLTSNRMKSKEIETDAEICPQCEDEYIHWFMNPDRTKEA